MGKSQNFLKIPLILFKKQELKYSKKKFILLKLKWLCFGSIIFSFVKFWLLFRVKKNLGSRFFFLSNKKFIKTKLSEGKEAPYSHFYPKNFFYVRIGLFRTKKDVFSLKFLKKQNIVLKKRNFIFINQTNFKWKEKKEKIQIKFLDLRLRSCSKLSLKQENRFGEDPLLFSQIFSSYENLQNFLKFYCDLPSVNSIPHKIPLWQFFLNSLKFLEQEQSSFHWKENKGDFKKKQGQTLFQKRNSFREIFRFFNHFYLEPKEGSGWFYPGILDKDFPKKKNQLVLFFLRNPKNPFFDPILAEKNDPINLSIRKKRKFSKFFFLRKLENSFYRTEFGNFFFQKKKLPNFLPKNNHLFFFKKIPFFS